MSSRITALWCWYHGGPFRGYQTQAQGPTVQGCLEAALRAAGLDVGTIASGRTDLGVHARKQVVSFRSPMPSMDVRQRLEGSLPPGMGVAHAADAKVKFSAQWKCTGKEYRYRLLRDDRAPAWQPFAWRVDVDPARVEAVLRHALGTHDFWAFHEKASPRRPRTISSIEVHPLGSVVDVRITGGGFGRYQVRYLVGSAVGVARGELREEDFIAGVQQAVEFRGAKAPAQGLTLWDVHYPPDFDPFVGAAAVLPPGPPYDVD